MTTKTKTKKTAPIFGDHLPITPFQIKRIMNNCSYNVEIKNEWVQWATNDVSRTSLKSITQAQAIKIISQQTGQNSPASEGLGEAKSPFGGWGAFNKNNPKHKLILSLCRQAQWTVKHAKYGEVADLGRLDKWLKSDRAPVNKSLLKMNEKEIQKTIAALSGIVKSIYK